MRRPHPPALGAPIDSHQTGMTRRSNRSRCRHRFARDEPTSVRTIDPVDTPQDTGLFAVFANVGQETQRMDPPIAVSNCGLRIRQTHQSRNLISFRGVLFRNITCRQVDAPRWRCCRKNFRHVNPSSGTWFHSLHATSQALQPMQTLGS